jgi:hypothetical protein
MKVLHLKCDELRGKCKSLGLISKGNKKDLRKRLECQLSWTQKCGLSKIVTCIDVGFKNFAVSTVKLKYQELPVLIDWRLIDLNLSRDFELSEAAESLKGTLNSSLPENVTEVYIESQTWSRNGAGSLHSTPGRILHLKALEALVYGMVTGSRPEAKIFQLSPRLVSDLFNIGDSHYAKKKKNAIGKANELLTNGSIILNETFREIYLNSAKKDDLADSLLMAMAVHSWWNNALQLLQQEYNATPVIVL